MRASSLARDGEKRATTTETSARGAGRGRGASARPVPASDAFRGASTVRRVPAGVRRGLFLQVDAASPHEPVLEYFPINRAESAAAAAARSPRRLTRAPVRVRSTRRRRLPRRRANRRRVRPRASRRPGAFRSTRQCQNALNSSCRCLRPHEPTRGEMIEMRGDLRGVRGRGIASGTPGGGVEDAPGERLRERSVHAGEPPRPRSGVAGVVGTGVPVLVREFPTAAAREPPAREVPSRRPRGGGLHAGSRARDGRAVCFVSEAPSGRSRRHRPDWRRGRRGRN